MNTKNTIIDYSSERHVVENISAVTPNIERTVFTKTFIIETVNLSNLSTLMITSDEGDQVGITHLIG